ncbi:MAG TPA: tRNA lysidine(34) synthetase TilS [Burkholderiales bacterium]
MENSKNSKGDRPAPSDRRCFRFFTAAALDAVLRGGELCLASDTDLYVAYSGGMDSHVLLHALADLRRRAPWRVTALHVDHGLQADSAKWARHCAAVCAALDVPYRSERVVVSESEHRGMEDAARRARYAALRRMLPSDAVLLTAHHRDDQAETLLLQLLRGAGAAGLAAMPAIAPFGRGRRARPLLNFERAALANYAKEQDLQWIDDATNFDVGPARNFLRHRILPLLDARWPAATERLAVSAKHMAEADRLLAELGQMDLAAAADADGRLRISSLLALSLQRQSNLLRYWIRLRTGAPPPESRLRELLARVARTPRSKQATVCWADVVVQRYRDCLAVFPAPPPIADDWEVAWNPATQLDIPGNGWRLLARAEIGAGIARDRVVGRRILVRLRRGGERARLRGHRHKVKKLLQEAGIPPWERRRWPLVYVDDELAAIGDRWVCEPYAAQPDEVGWVLRISRGDFARE